jgi:hypothetical protein
MVDDMEKGDGTFCSEFSTLFNKLAFNYVELEDGNNDSFEPHVIFMPTSSYFFEIWFLC